MGYWAQVRHIVTCSCDAAAELSSRRQDERLSRVDQLAWLGHLLVCRSCRNFNRQLHVLRSLTRRLASQWSAGEEGSNGLSEEARARIAQAMRNRAME